MAVKARFRTLSLLAVLAASSCDDTKDVVKDVVDPRVGVKAGIDGGVEPLRASELESSKLPTPASDAAVQMVFGVEVAADGTISVDGKEHTLETLRQAASDARAKDPHLRAVIRGDKDARHGRIIQVLDALKQAGVNKIAFGVTPIAGPPPSAPHP